MCYLLYTSWLPVIFSQQLKILSHWFLDYLLLWEVSSQFCLFISNLPSSLPYLLQELLFFLFLFFLMFCSLTILWLYCAFWIWGLVSFISSETSYSFFLTFPLSPFFSSRAPVRLMWELLTVFVITLNHSYFPSFECLCLIQESNFFQSFFQFFFFFICN